MNTMDDPESLSLALPDGSTVSALLQVPKDARALYVFAHGAGAGMQHAGMSSLADAGSKMNGACAGPRKLGAMALMVWTSTMPSVAKVGRSAGPGRNFDTALPYMGNSSVPLGRRGLPVSQ